MQAWRLAGSLSYCGEPDTVPLLATWGSLHAVQAGEVTEAEVHTGRAPCAQEGRCWRQGCGGQSIQGLRAGAVAPVPLATGRWKVLLR